MKNYIFIRDRLLLISGLMVSAVSAQTSITDFCFDISSPSNFSTIQVLDPDDNPYMNQTIGQLQFQVSYREDVTDPLAIAGTATYDLEVDSNGFFIDNGGTHCASFGTTITDVAQIEISMSINAFEWSAAGIDVWSLDNIVLLNGTNELLEWDYNSDANASFVDPLITSNGGLGDAWSGDLISPSVMNDALEFTFTEGGGGGGSFLYDVATIPEPSSTALVGLGLFTLMSRRRTRNSK